MEWKNLVLKAHLNSNPLVPEELVKQGSKLQHISLQGQATPNHSAYLLLEAVLQDTLHQSHGVAEFQVSRLFSLSATAFQA